MKQLTVVGGEWLQQTSAEFDQIFLHMGNDGLMIFLTGKIFSYVVSHRDPFRINMNQAQHNITGYVVQFEFEW